jgi:hypothetical protein
MEKLKCKSCSIKKNGGEGCKVAICGHYYEEIGFELSQLAQSLSLHLVDFSALTSY